MSGKEEVLVEGKPLSSLRVIDLKSELEQRGLSKSGSKKELTDRLRKQIELERSRESSANDEEHVPNLGLNEDGNLSSNDFIREYLASQQAAYQKEKEAKKIFEEERLRESESAGDTTQDEDESEQSMNKTIEELPPPDVESPKPRPERSTPIDPKKRELSRIASEEAGDDHDVRSPRRSKRQRSSMSEEVPEVEIEESKEADKPHEPIMVEPISAQEKQPGQDRLSSDLIAELSRPEQPSSSEPLKPASVAPTANVTVVESVQMPVESAPEPTEPKSERKFEIESRDGKVNKEEEDKVVIEEVPEARREETKAQQIKEKVDQTPVLEVKASGEGTPVQQIAEKADHKPALESGETQMTALVTDKMGHELDSPSVEKRKLKRPTRSHEEQEDLLVIKKAQEAELETKKEGPQPPIKNIELLNRGEEQNGKLDENSRNEFEISLSLESDSTLPLSRMESSELSEVEKEEDKSREETKPRKLKRERPSDIYVPPARRISDGKAKDFEAPREGRTSKHSPVEPPLFKPEVDIPFKPSSVKPEMKIRIKTHSTPTEVVTPVAEAVTEEKSITPLGLEEPEVELNYGCSDESDEEKSVKEEKMDVDEVEKTEGKPSDRKSKRRSLPSVAGDDDEPYRKLKRPHQPRPLTPPPRKEIEGARGLRRPKPESIESPPVALRRPNPETLESPVKMEIAAGYRDPEPVLDIDFSKLNFRKLKTFKSLLSENVSEGTASRVLLRLETDTAVTADLLQNWYPDVTQQTEEPAISEIDEHELVLSPERPEPEDLDVLPNSTRRVVKEVDDDAEVKPEAEGPALPEKVKKDIRQANRTAALAHRQPVRSDRPLSPASAPLSSVLSVMNLTRPFTVTQLKELLGRTGQIVEGGFWIDKVKSRCLVEYTSEEEAAATRDALHGVKWPGSNPKLLYVDYSTKENLENHINGCEDRPPSPPHAPRPRHADKEVKEVKKEAVKGVRSEEEAKKFASVLRQWDADKLFKDYDDEIQERQRRGGGFEEEDNWNYEKDRVAKKGSGEMLDVLFRKTKTKPCIYYLPLTEEQIAEKEKKRQLILAERERLRLELAATAKVSPPRRRSPSPPPRRRSPPRNGRKKSPARKSRSTSRKRSKSPSRRRPSATESPERRHKRSNSPQRRR